MNRFNDLEQYFRGTVQMKICNSLEYHILHLHELHFPSDGSDTGFGFTVKIGKINTSSERFIDLSFPLLSQLPLILNLFWTRVQYICARG